MGNILFIIPSLKRAGAETQTVLLANGFAQKGYHVSLITLSKQSDLLSDLDERVQMFQFEKRSKLDFRLVKKIANIVDDHAIDCIFCSMQYSYLYGWFSRLLCSRKPLLVASIHTTINVGLKEELQDRMLYQFILRSAEKIIFVCRSQMEHWINKYEYLRKNSVVVYNGVDENHFSPAFALTQTNDLKERLGISDDAFVISSIAGFRPEKNHSGLVDVFSQLDDRANLVLAGDGELRKKVEHQVEVAGLSSRVHFLGVVQDVRPVLCMSDVVVMPSTAVETFSIAMLESMSMGVPTVVSDIGGQKEAFVHGESGWHFPVGDEGALKLILVSCMEDGQQLVQAGKLARERVKCYFSRDIMVRQTIDEVQELLDGR